MALVTGASGITGRHCVHACLKRNEEWRVITLARRDLQLGGEGATDQVQQVRLRGTSPAGRQVLGDSWLAATRSVASAGFFLVLWILCLLPMHVRGR